MYNFANIDLLLDIIALFTVSLYIVATGTKLNCEYAIIIIGFKMVNLLRNDEQKLKVLLRLKFTTFL